LSSESSKPRNLLHCLGMTVPTGGASRMAAIVPLREWATGREVPGVSLSGTEGHYSNYLEIGQNAFEFVLLFGQRYGDQEQPVIHCKIIANPFYAKRFAEMLQESIRRHETALGPIPDEEP